MRTKAFNYNVVFFILGYLFFLSLYWWTFSIGITLDSLIFRVAGTLPQAQTLSYWLDIFASPNNGPQYRPLGFFGYFFITQKLFGDNIIAHRLLACVLYSLTLYLTWIAARRMSGSFVAGGLSFLFLAIHYGWVFPILDISCVAKYLLTVFLLTLGINISLDEKKSSIGKGITLTLITMISIFCMEGAVVFPLIFVLFFFIKKK